MSCKLRNTQTKPNVDVSPKSLKSPVENQIVPNGEIHYLSLPRGVLIQRCLKMSLEEFNEQTNIREVIRNHFRQEGFTEYQINTSLDEYVRRIYISYQKNPQKLRQPNHYQDLRIISRPGSVSPISPRKRKPENSEENSSPKPKNKRPERNQSTNRSLRAAKSCPIPFDTKVIFTDPRRVATTTTTNESTKLAERVVPKTVTKTSELSKSESEPIGEDKLRTKKRVSSSSTEMELDISRQQNTILCNSTNTSIVTMSCKRRNIQTKPNADISPKSLKSPFENQIVPNGEIHYIPLPRGVLIQRCINMSLEEFNEQTNIREVIRNHFRQERFTEYQINTSLDEYVRRIYISYHKNPQKLRQPNHYQDLRIISRPGSVSPISPRKRKPENSEENCSPKPKTERPERNPSTKLAERVVQKTVSKTSELSKSEPEPNNTKETFEDQNKKPTNDSFGENKLRPKKRVSSSSTESELDNSGQQKRITPSSQLVWLPIGNPIKKPLIDQNFDKSICQLTIKDFCKITNIEELFRMTINQMQLGEEKLQKVDEYAADMYNRFLEIQNSLREGNCDKETDTEGNSTIRKSGLTRSENDGTRGNNKDTDCQNKNVEEQNTSGSTKRVCMSISRNKAIDRRIDKDRNDVGAVKDQITFLSDLAETASKIEDNTASKIEHNIASKIGDIRRSSNISSHSSSSIDSIRTVIRKAIPLTENQSKIIIHSNVRVPVPLIENIQQNVSQDGDDSDVEIQPEINYSDDEVECLGTTPYISNTQLSLLNDMQNIIEDDMSSTHFLPIQDVPFRPETLNNNSIETPPVDESLTELNTSSPDSDADAETQLDVSCAIIADANPALADEVDNLGSTKNDISTMERNLLNAMQNVVDGKSSPRPEAMNSIQMPPSPQQNIIESLSMGKPNGCDPSAKSSEKTINCETLSCNGTRNSNEEYKENSESLPKKHQTNTEKHEKEQSVHYSDDEDYYTPVEQVRGIATAEPNTSSVDSDAETQLDVSYSLSDHDYLPYDENQRTTRNISTMEISLPNATGYESDDEIASPRFSPIRRNVSLQAEMIKCNSIETSPSPQHIVIESLAIENPNELSAQNFDNAINLPTFCETFPCSSGRNSDEKNNGTFENLPNNCQKSTIKQEKEQYSQYCDDVEFVPNPVDQVIVIDSDEPNTENLLKEFCYPFSGNSSDDKEFGINSTTSLFTPPSPMPTNSQLLSSDMTLVCNVNLSPPTTTSVNEPAVEPPQQQQPAVLVSLQQQHQSAVSTTTICQTKENQQTDELPINHERQIIYKSVVGRTYTTLTFVELKNVSLPIKTLSYSSPVPFLERSKDLIAKIGVNQGFISNMNIHGDSIRLLLGFADNDWRRIVVLLAAIESFNFDLSNPAPAMESIPYRMLYYLFKTLPKFNQVTIQCDQTRSIYDVVCVRVRYTKPVVSLAQALKPCIQNKILEMGLQQYGHKS